jgi:hypothetical protein
MRKSPKCDPQRSEIYTWDSSFGATMRGDFGTRAFYKLLRNVCSEWGVPRPKSGDMPRSWRKHWVATCDTDNKAIWFNPEYCTARTLLHELAHWILHYYGYRGTAHHNGLWLGVYMRLMHDNNVLPINASVPSARAAKLVFLDPKACTPTAARLLIEQANQLGRPAS